MADDGNVLPRRLLVAKLIEHAISDGAPEFVLSLVLFLTRKGEIPRVDHDSGGCQALFLAARSQALDRHFVLCIELDALCLHFLDFGEEPAIWQNAELLRALLKHLQQLITGRPWVVVRGARQRLIKAQVVHAQLSLKFGRHVRLVPPSHPTDLGLPVEDHEIVLAVLQEDHGLPQADMPGTHDDYWVFQLRPFTFETLDAFHQDLASYLFRVLVFPPERPLLADEGHLAWLDP
mmetsp:Transcript_25371/g.58848  ORF Transcript_25371/g.58848 Transcript_25371/m.58848 type:complete len:234 (+) Transcript_25371:1109-1810(+)